MAAHHDEHVRLGGWAKTLNDILGQRPNRSDYGLALGGILTGRRVIAGEAGAEAVIPLSNDRAAVMMRKAFGDRIGGDTV
ncbi:MAG: hypothetical protein EBR82_28190, partial [Caulobacteraceae bacterium]|nr:hypothetical protein [Caulobacteraceae bacterium]